jgi:hypothetical protein
MPASVKRAEWRINVDKAIYIFRHGTQWNDEIMGIVANNAVDALEIARTVCQNMSLNDLVRYTLVKDEVENGIHFEFEIDNPAYEG